MGVTSTKELVWIFVTTNQKQNAPNQSNSLIGAFAPGVINHFNHGGYMHFRSDQGFTLVEVIVTAVIVVILAAVAIPNYIGYVAQTRQDAVDGLAETVAAAANSHWRKTASVPTLASLGITYDSTKYKITVGTTTVSCSTKTVTPVRFKSVSYK